MSDSPQDAAALILIDDLERRLRWETYLVSEAQREMDEVRTILAGTDISSLPNDYPLTRMARNRMDERDKFRWQVIDTCKRAEAAEAQRDAALAEKGKP